MKKKELKAIIKDQEITICSLYKKLNDQMELIDKQNIELEEYKEIEYSYMVEKDYSS